MAEVKRMSTSSSAHSAQSALSYISSDKQFKGLDKDKKQPYVYKSLIFCTTTSVVNMVIGISNTYPGLITDRKTRVVMIPQEDVTNAVGLISGGGSGHEPFPSGLVGNGMLTASVSGHVFTTPSSSWGLAAIYNVNLFKKGGVMVFILNYSGTMLQFNQACDFARDMGIRADTLVVGEECPLQKGNKKVLTGRRGLVGMVFIIKIAGAMSERGAKLAVIKGACSEAVNLMASITISNKCCILPGQTEPHFTVRQNHIQLGVGVHGQAGNETLEFTSSSETVRIIMRKISTVLKLNAGNSVCAIVSSLGGSTLLECYTIAADLSHELGKMDISLERMYVATLFSALDMGGLQVCIMKVTEENRDWISCLDDHTDAPAWPGRSLSFEKSRYLFKEVKFNKVQYTGRKYGHKETAIFRNCVERAAHKILDVHDVIEKLGRMGGYGNAGMDFKIFAEAILQELSELPFSWPRPFMLKLSNLASEDMGGRSGGLYCLMLKAASQDAPNWPRCLEAAVRAVSHYTSAVRGDGTLLDALIPASEELLMHQTNDKWKPYCHKALDEARKGMEATSRQGSGSTGSMMSDEDEEFREILSHRLDPGAFAATCWLEAVIDEILEQNL